MINPVYADLDMELSKQTDGDVLRDIDVEAVKNSLMNIINTQRGSRRMLPTFAVGIHSLLFEPMDESTARRLGNNIIEAIKLWEDRISIGNLHVHANYDYSQYECLLTFSIRNVNKEEQLTFILKRT